VFTNADLDLLQAELNRHVRDGALTLLNSGRNEYRLRLFGDATTRVLVLTVQPRLVLIPLGWAEVRINALRFREARVRWNAAERALHVQLLIEDKADGLMGVAHILQNAQPFQYAVEAARFHFLVEPHVAPDGRLDFRPVRASLFVNTDEAVPELRGIVRETLAEVAKEVQKDAQRAFDLYRADLIAWLSAQLPEGSVLTDIAIADTQAVFRTRAGAAEDVNEDGWVDIADLVAIGLAFGRSGPPGFLRADVTGDGVVDIADLVRVALRFGGRAAPSRTPTRPDRRR
jgi:hypothetical protein